MMERNPRAPVLRSMAFLAIAPIAGWFVPTTGLCSASPSPIAYA
jgi:hypothetical protein